MAYTHELIQSKLNIDPHNVRKSCVSVGWRIGCFPSALAASRNLGECVGAGRGAFQGIEPCYGEVALPLRSYFSAIQSRSAARDNCICFAFLSCCRRVSWFRDMNRNKIVSYPALS